MKVLVDKANAKILCYSLEVNPVFQGGWGEGISNGTLVLLEAPPGQKFESLEWNGVAVVVGADPSKKSNSQKKEARRERLMTADLSDPKIDPLLVDLILEWRKI